MSNVAVQGELLKQFLKSPEPRAWCMLELIRVVKYS